MKALFSHIQTFGSEHRQQFRRHAPWFAPGVFFILLGAVALIAPRLVVAVVATMFFFVGCVICVLGWKLMQLKARVEKMARQFDGKVIIQGVNIRPDGNSGSETDQKKIVVH